MLALRMNSTPSLQSGPPSVYIPAVALSKDEQESRTAGVRGTVRGEGHIGETDQIDLGSRLDTIAI